MSDANHSVVDPNQSGPASPASTFTGWALLVNKNLWDAEEESMQPSGGSSDEDRNEVIQEDLPDPAPEVAHQDRHQDVQNRTNFPCLFFSYLTCAKGRLCEFSHSIHADKVRVPSAPTRRGTARRRIQRRVERHFSTANLYDVHTALQREAEKDQYARVLIRKNLRAIATFSTGSIWL